MRYVTLTVCVEDADAEDVRTSLDEWFSDSDFAMSTGGARINTCTPAAERDENR